MTKSSNCFVVSHRVLPALQSRLVSGCNSHRPWGYTGKNFTVKWNH